MAVSREPEAKRTSVTVVVPVFQEGHTVQPTLRELAAHLGRLGGYDWDIVVVDDGSDDGSGALAAAAAQSMPFPVTVVRHLENCKLGAALRTGFAYSSGDLVVVIDCDLTYSLDHIDRMIEAWERTRPHIVVASAYAPGGSSIAVPTMISRRSRIANRLLSSATYEDVDTLTGMVRLYDGPFIRALPLKAVGPDANVEILYKAQAMRARVVQVPATLDWSGRRDRAGRSKILSRATVWTTLKSLLMSFLFKPYVVPCLSALTCAVIAVAAAVRGGFSAEAVMAAASVMCLVSAYFAVSMLQSKRYFEELFTALSEQGGTYGRPLAPHVTLRDRATGTAIARQRGSSVPIVPGRDVAAG